MNLVFELVDVLNELIVSRIVVIGIRFVKAFAVGLMVLVKFHPLSFFTGHVYIELPRLDYVFREVRQVDVLE